MSVAGSLFVYSQEYRLVAFAASGLAGASNVVVLLGGLGDSLHCVPFFAPLAETVGNLGWTLVQV